MSKLFKFSMFITSFYPLWISILFKDIVSLYTSKCRLTEIISIVIIVLMNILATAVVLYAIKFAEKSTPNPGFFNIVSAEKSKGITSEFLLSYILPFFAFDFTQWKDIILFMVYFLTLAFLCIRNDNVYANILLELKSYHFYQCSLSYENGDQIISKLILSKNNLSSQINHSIYIYTWNSTLAIDKTTPGA